MSDNEHLTNELTNITFQTMNIKLNRGKCSKAGEVVSKTTWVSSILTVLANNTKSLFSRDSQSPTLNPKLPYAKCHRHTSPSDAGAIRKEYPKTNMDESKLHVIPNSIHFHGASTALWEYIR